MDTRVTQEIWRVEALIKSAASTASLMAWELHGSATAGRRPLAELLSGRSHHCNSQAVEEAALAAHLIMVPKSGKRTLPGSPNEKGLQSLPDSRNPIKTT